MHTTRSVGWLGAIVASYWVFSLVITVLAVAVVLGHMADVSAMAAIAVDPNADISRLSGDLDHSIGGLLMLLTPWYSPSTSRVA